MNQSQNSLNSLKSTTKQTSILPPITRKSSSPKSKPLTIIDESFKIKETTSTPFSSPRREFKPKINLSLNNNNNTNKSTRIKKINDSGDSSSLKTETSVETIKKRLNALKLLQHDMAKLEVSFYQDLYYLECQYLISAKKINDSRRKIIIGEHEPTNKESDLDFLLTNTTNGDTLMKEKEITRDLAAIKLVDHHKGYIRGIPDFWLTVLQNVSLINQMIEPHDKPILKHLTDIDFELNDKKPFSFKLKFHFDSNDYFENSLLTKTYFFQIELDKTSPFMFEAPESQNSIGCTINWRKNKNVTRNSKDELQESFFNYFTTINLDDSIDDEADLALDYDIGYTFKEKLIPRALLYYLGEIFEDNDFENLKIELEQDDLKEDIENNSD